jgi:2-polyprenyl-3-methyl-5-hydroxy-6-metoxy-1,4-benzoquinol methylase
MEDISKKISKGIKYLFHGDYLSLIIGLRREYYNFLFVLMKIRSSKLVNRNIKVITKHQIAYESPDHIAPCGTMQDDSTNRTFIILIDKLLKRDFEGKQLNFLDLGCSGGQLVRDFRDLGYISVGLEGSDYSQKHKRANWPLLGGKNLFTCDIKEPFEIISEDKIKFHLITAWEVLEHIRRDDLDNLFLNIISHLEEGGYFIASTSSSSSYCNDLELHQTRMTNDEWRKYIQGKYRELIPTDLGFRYYEYVRYSTVGGENSFLLYKKSSLFEKTP